MIFFRHVRSSVLSFKVRSSSVDPHIFIRLSRTEFEHVVTDSNEPTIVRLNKDQPAKWNEIVEVVSLLRAIMFRPVGNGGHVDRAQVLAESFRDN